MESGNSCTAFVKIGSRNNLAVWDGSFAGPGICKCNLLTRNASEALVFINCVGLAINNRGSRLAGTIVSDVVDTEVTSNAFVEINKLLRGFPPEVEASFATNTCDLVSC